MERGTTVAIGILAGVVYEVVWNVNTKISLHTTNREV